MKYYFEFSFFQFSYFILFLFYIIVGYSIFRDSKNRGARDPVHILKDPVHGPGPRGEVHWPGSMFCTSCILKKTSITDEDHI